MGFQVIDDESLRFVQQLLKYEEDCEVYERKGSSLERWEREQWFFNDERTRDMSHYNVVSTKEMLINLKKQLSSLTQRYKRETSFQLF